MTNDSKHQESDWKLPPKKRNWKPGTWQLGFFVRDPEGDTTTVIIDDARKEQAELAIALFCRSGSKS